MDVKLSLLLSRIRIAAVRGEWRIELQTSPMLAHGHDANPQSEVTQYRYKIVR